MIFLIKKKAGLKMAKLFRTKIFKKFVQLLFQEINPRPRSLLRRDPKRPNFVIVQITFREDATGLFVGLDSRAGV